MYEILHKSHRLLVLPTSLALVLTACGITITAVHLPDEVQVNVGAAETAATMSKQEADSAAQRAAEQN